MIAVFFLTAIAITDIQAQPKPLKQTEERLARLEQLADPQEFDANKFRIRNWSLLESATAKSLDEYMREREMAIMIKRKTALFQYLVSLATLSDDELNDLYLQEEWGTNKQGSYKLVNQLKTLTRVLYQVEDLKEPKKGFSWDLDDGSKDDWLWPVTYVDGRFNMFPVQMQYTGWISSAKSECEYVRSAKVPRRNLGKKVEK